LPTLQQEIEHLVQIRIRSGTSLLSIEDKTKIRVAYLRAIEAGDFARLPDGVYRVNYVTQYARAIDEEICGRLTESLRSMAGIDPEDWNRNRPYWWAHRFLPGMAAVMAMAAVGVQGQTPAASQNACAADSRCEALVKFFKRYGSPLAPHAWEFVRAADRHGLDWRLLPGLAMVETTGGKYARNANVFGWNSGRTDFASIPAGIRHVAAQLANSKLYRGKDLQGILKQYNPARSTYAIRVMRFIDELPLLAALGAVPSSE
jgi:hypothetical protein